MDVYGILTAANAGLPINAVGTVVGLAGLALAAAWLAYLYR